MTKRAGPLDVPGKKSPSVINSTSFTIGVVDLFVDALCLYFENNN